MAGHTGRLMHSGWYYMDWGATEEYVDRSYQETGAYSVWAIPSKDTKVRLIKLMDGLRTKFGGPNFDPHLTVVPPMTLSREDAFEKFGMACRGLKAYHAQAKDISFGNSFWQSVYIRLHPTHEVVIISDYFDTHFGYNRSTPYMPHISLLYGDLTDEEKHEALKEAKILDDTIDSMSFEIDRLELCTTPDDNTLESWVKVDEYELGAH